jgi:hypothetical protein
LKVSQGKFLFWVERGTVTLHLKIERRLRDETFESVKGECVISVEDIGVPSILRLIRILDEDISDLRTLRKRFIIKR